MSDEPQAALLEAFVHGDERAFEALFQRFERDVFRWALRIVRDRAAAEDVVVEAFWRAYRSRARFDPGRSFGAWIRRIATNVALDHLRTLRGREQWIDVDAHDAAARVAAGVSRQRPESTRAAETRDAMARAFRSLPPKLLVAALLALVEQQPYEEIADALDVPVGTVKSRVFRAIRALRDALTRLGVSR